MTTSAMRKIVASVLGAILALTGVLITPAAWAAGPTVTVIPVGREGGDITISGKGFSTTGFGVYVAVAPASVPEFYGNSDKFYGYDPSKDTTESPSTIWVYTPSQKAIGSRFAQGRPMNNDGSFTITMKAPPFEQGKDFVVLTTKAHGVGKTDHSDDTRTPVTYREATPAPTGPKTPTAPSKQPSKQAAHDTTAEDGRTQVPDSGRPSHHDQTGLHNRCVQGDLGFADLGYPNILHQLPAWSYCQWLVEAFGRRQLERFGLHFPSHQRLIRSCYQIWIS